MRKWLLLLLGIGALAFTGCDGKAVTSTVVELSLTKDGGTLLGPNGTRVIVPIQPDLTYPVTMSFALVPNAAVPTLPGYERLSTGFIMQSSRVFTFSPAARLEMRYADSQLSEAVQNSDLAIFRCDKPLDIKDPDAVSPAWTKLEKGVAETTQHVYQVDITLPGVYAVFVPESALGVDGDADSIESEAEAEPEAAAR